MTYQPPKGDQTEGLRRSRMLGRLAWDVARVGVGGAIQDAMNDALRIHQKHVADGLMAEAEADRLKVFVVASACGGTGSAGFLEVVNQIWQACDDAVQPEIRAFLYLPGVFHDALSTSPDKDSERRAHKSNAFAFFTELDHFLLRSSQLPQKMDPDGVLTNIPDNSLLEQVFLIDNTIQGKGRLKRVEDAYATTAEAIYQYLMTNMGRPTVGANAVNSTVLTTYDQRGKPRRYCGLGVARVVFPAHTYERHLRYLFTERFIRSGLLWDDREAIQETVREDAHIEGFLGELQNAMMAPAGRAEPAVQRFLGMAGEAAETLAEEPTVGSADRLQRLADRQQAEAVQQLADAADLRVRTMSRDLPPRLERAVLAPGRGITYSRAGLRHVRATLTKRLERATDAQRQAQAHITNVDDRWDDQRRQLRELQSSRLARFRQGAIQEAARQLGQLIDTRASSLVEAYSAESEASAVTALIDHVDLLDRQLERSEQTLFRRAQEAQRAWQDDELRGKDSGPRDTTTLIPEDVHPEIEESELSRQVQAALTREIAEDLLGSEAAVGKFLMSWYEEGEKGPFGLGDREDPDRRATAERRFNELLYALTEERALRDQDRQPRLPQSLKAAAGRDPGSLSAAVKSLGALSSSVCVSYEPARVLPGAGAKPTVTSSFAVPSELTDDLSEIVDTKAQFVHSSADPDKITALSQLWGLPLHSLAEVGSWAQAYEAVLRQRRSNPGTEYPPHLDRRWESGDEELEALVPLPYDWDDAIGVTAAALLIARAVHAVHRERIEDLFERLRAHDDIPVPVVEDTGHDRPVYVSRSLERIDGTWRSGTRRDIGDLPDLVAHLGVDDQDRHAVVSLLDDLRDAVGEEQIRGTARDYATSLRDLLDRGDFTGEEQDIVHDLCLAFDEQGRERRGGLMDA